MNDLNQSLTLYQIYNDADLLENDTDAGPVYKKYQALFYFIGLTLGELSWIAISLASYFQQSMCFFGAGIMGWVLLWSTFGVRKRYMKAGQYIFWIQGCYHTLMLILAQMLQKHQFVLCGSGTGIIFFIALQLLVKRKVTSSKAYFYIYLWYSQIFYYSLTHLYLTPFSWYMMIILDIYFIFFTGIYIKLQYRRHMFTKFAQWQLTCLSYPLSLILTLALAGSFPSAQFQFSWIWFTVINHFVYFCCCAFLFTNRKILPILKKNSKPVLINDQSWGDDNRQKLFQVSNNFLSREEEFMYNPRDSMKGGVQVSQCCICMDKSSSFCYFNCLHLSICDVCALELLGNNRRNCPFCRQDSNILLSVERVNGIIFAVTGKYRFRN